MLTVALVNLLDKSKQKICVHITQMVVKKGFLMVTGMSIHYFWLLLSVSVSVCIRRRFPSGLLCDGVVCADLVALTENLQFEVLSFIDAHY